MFKCIRVLLTTISLTASFSSLAATISPTEFESGVTTAIKVLDNGVDVTTQYTFSSTDISVVVMSGKPYIMGQTAGQKTISAIHSEANKNENFLVDVIPGKATKLVVHSGNLQKAAIGENLSLPIVVKAIDNAGNGVSGVSIDFRSSSESAIVSPASISTGPDGTASVEYTVGNIVGNESVTATGPSYLSRVRSVVFTETVTRLSSTAPAKLTISVPSSVDSNTDFPTPVSVSIYTESGVLYKTESKNVRISAYKNSSCSVLSSPPLQGTLSQATSEGTASFSGIRFPTSGYIYVRADVEGLPSVCSSQIAIKATAVSNPQAHVPITLNYTAIGTSYRAGLTFNPQVKLQLLDDAGKVYNKNVSISIKAYSDSECTIEASPALSGVTTVTSSFGNVVYTALSYSQVKKIYLQASYSPYVSACAPVDIDPDPAKTPALLKFSSFSTTGEINKPILSNPKVSILSSTGFVMSSPSMDVSLSAFTDSACSIPAEGTLLTEPSVAASVNGVASFTKVIYSKAENIHFKASSGNISGCSASITFTGASAGSPNKLVMTQSPSGEFKVNQQVATPVNIEVRDVNNVKTSFGSLSVNLGFFTDSACSVSANSALSQTKISSNGTVSFSVSPFSSPGSYYVKASSGTLTPACSNLINVSCLDNYTGSNGACSPTLCTTQDINFSSSVMGNKIDGCVVTSCQSNYFLNSSSNSCQSFNAPVLTASSSEEKIALSWTSSSVATLFNVYRKTGAGSFSIIKPNNSSLSFDDVTAESGVIYSYVVTGVKDGVETAQSNIVTGIKPVSNPTNVQVSSLYVAPNYNANITWTNIPSGVSSYNIYRKNGNSQSEEPYTKLIGNPTSSPYVDSSITLGNSYTYKISGNKVSGGETGFSDEVTLTLEIPVPQNFTVTEGTSPSYGANVSWSQVNGASGYLVYRKVGNGSFSNIATVQPAGVTSYADTMATGNETYTYYVQAYVDLNVSEKTTEKSIVIKVPAPSNLSASVQSSGVGLSWSSPGGPISGFTVYRKIGENGSFSSIGTTQSSIQSYFDSTAAGGYTYYYYVVSYFNSPANMSDSTLTVSATVIIQTPEMLTAQEISSPSRGVGLSWQYSGQAEKFNIYRKDATAQSYSSTPHATVNHPSTSYSDYSIQLDVTYNYIVKAANGVAESLSSNETTMTIISSSACTLQDAMANGVNTSNSNSTIVGTAYGSNVSQCLLASNSCNDFYKIASNSKSCLAKNCNELTNSEKTTLGYNTGSYGTLSGVYPSCSLTCSGGATLSQDGKSCFSYVTYSSTITGAGSIVGTSESGEQFQCNTGSCSAQVLEGFGVELKPVPLHGNYQSSWGQDCMGILTKEVCRLFSGNNKVFSASFIEKFNKARPGFSGQAQVGGGLSPTARKLISRQSDGSIIVGISTTSGTSVTFNGTQIQQVVRFSSDGIFDHTFNPGFFNGRITALTVMPDDSILVGGTFTQLTVKNETGENVVKNRGRLVKLNKNGSEDSAFYLKFAGTSVEPSSSTTGISSSSAYVSTIAVQSSGSILVGGAFTAINGTKYRNRMFRLNSDGSEDEAFYFGSDSSLTRSAATPANSSTSHGFNSEVYRIEVQPDGKLLVGGNFTQLNATMSLRNRLLRLNSDGTEDSLFYCGSANSLAGSTCPIGATDHGISGGPIEDILLSSDGKIVIVGSFTTINAAQFRGRIAKLNMSGSEDSAFYCGSQTSFIGGACPTGTGTGFEMPVNNVREVPTGKILVSGQFNGATVTGGVAKYRRAIMRLNLNGTEDTAFYYGSANSLTGKVAAPTQTNINSSENHGFENGMSNTYVSSILGLPGGRALIGGAFSTVNNMPEVNFVGLESTGKPFNFHKTNRGLVVSGKDMVDGFTLDTASIARQSDGKVVVGGRFWSYNNTQSPGVTRINSDGTIDSSFASNIGSGPNKLVKSIAIQSDGKILVVGDFSQWNGKFRSGIVRLNSNGTEDTAFYFGSPSASVSGSTSEPIAENTHGFRQSTVAADIRAVAVQSDGKIIVSGVFDKLIVAGATRFRNNILRLNSNGSEDSAFYCGNATTSFIRSATCPTTTPNHGFYRDGSATNYSDIPSVIEIVGSTHILVGGNFTTYWSAGVQNFRNKLIRINSSGNEDTAFYFGGVSSFSGLTTTPASGGTHGANSGIISAIKRLSSGQILVGGSISQLNGLPRSGIIRLNSNGTEDTVFLANLHEGTTGTPGFGSNSSVGTVTSFGITSDNKIVVGGSFNRLRSSSGDKTRHNLVVLNSEGYEDSTFWNNQLIKEDGSIATGSLLPWGNGLSSVNARTVINPDDSIIVIGPGGSFNGSPYDGIIKIKPTGGESN